MGILAKSRKKIILSVVSVVLALVAVALAIIIGTAPVKSEAMAGTSVLTGETYTACIKSINAATDSASLKTSVTVDQAKALEPNENRYVRKALVDKASALGVTDTGLTTPRGYLDTYYQWQYVQNSDGTYSGAYLKGTLTQSVDRSAGGANYIKGVADGGVTVPSGITLKLGIGSPFFTFHGPIIIDGGTVEISVRSDYNGAAGTMLKREVEPTLRDTSTGLIDVNATDNVVTQYSGSLFIIKNGTLKITGNSSYSVSISGAGNFEFDYTASTEEDADHEFPAQSDLGSADDVKASGPVIQIYDGDTGTSSLQLTKTSIYSNYNYGEGGTYGGHGGAFGVSGRKPTVTMTDCRIERCYSRESGALMLLQTTEGGSVTMTNTNVYHCYSPGYQANGLATNGGILRAYGSNMATLTMTGCSIYENWTYRQNTITWAALGAAMNVTVDGETQSVGCYITGCKIYDNTAYYGGAGVYNSGSMLIKSTTISGNLSVVSNGGGVVVSTWASSTSFESFQLTKDGSMTLGEGVVISGNKAPNGMGGGISVACGAIGTNTGSTPSIYFYRKQDGTPYAMNIIIDGAIITENEAFRGGGIAITKSKFGAATDTYLYESGVYEEDGALNYTGATANNSMYVVQFEMRDGEVSDNTASTYSGAEANVYAHAGGIYINDANGTGNTASFIMSGGTISGNKATHLNASRGGAVYVLGGGSFYMSGGSIEGNTAYGFGGAVAIKDGNFNMSGTGVIQDNLSYYQGGAAYVENGAFNMSGGTIKNNRTHTKGGGAFVTGGSFNMTGGTISSNTALNEDSDTGEDVIADGNDGGGAFVTGGGSLTLSNGSITGNIAGSQGGGVYIETGSFTMNSGSLSNNRSYGSAGGAFVKNGNFTLNNGEVTSNKALNMDDTSSSGNTGGGVFVTGGGTLTIENGTVKLNSSGGSGGAFFVDGGGTAVIKNGNITQNTAGNGGACVRISNGYCNILGGSFTNNTARAAGGVIFKDGASGQVTISGGTFDGNKSTEEYGGVVFSKGGSVNISGGTFTNNYAKLNGGVISLATESVTTDGVTTVIPCYFYMTAGTMTDNSTDGMGGAVYVKDATEFEFGYEGCFGNGVYDEEAGEWLHTTERAPVVRNNTANEGGAFYIKGGNPTIHCGIINDNHAVSDANGGGGNGGGIYVSNAGVTVNFADINENDATNKGGAIYVSSSSANVSVVVDSGVISYNTADIGSGIGVEVTGSYTATVTIGREGCSGAEESEHKHPQISYNIATTKGGGLYFVSESSTGIKFTMYCGYIGNNTANANIPTGNIFQQGGTISIAGDYAIENATVLNGTYLRPGISEKTITIVYHYNNAAYTAAAPESSTVTVAIQEGDDRMFINLPAVDGKYDNKMLVSWELKDSAEGAVKETHVVGEKLILSTEYPNYQADTTVNFYGVWLAAGDAYLEPSFVQTGKVFSEIESGLPYAYGKINNPFSVQFTVSKCNPYEFGERNLVFSETAPAGTVIYMLYFKGTKTDFYFYNVKGDELTVNLDSFRRLGDPGSKWTNTVNQSDSSERFLFTFDFARAEEGVPGAVQITLERYYDESIVGEVRAPLSQVVSYTMDDAYLPKIESSVTETKPDTDVEITYDAGIAAESDSLYYGEEVSLVIRDTSGVLDAEAYMLLDGNAYYKNSEGVFILPIGAANTSSAHTLSLHSNSLALRADRTVNLTVSLYITPDAEKPLVSLCVDSLNITFIADKTPAASIALDKRVYYTDSLPETVDVITTLANDDGCTLTYKVEKLDNGIYSADAAAAEGVSITNEGTLTFGNATFGTFRITLTVTKNDVTVSQIPYNFIVLDR